MKKICSIDIETYADMDMVKFLPPVTADTRLKDEAKIQADIEKKKQDQIEKMPLNPMFSKIACIGYYSEDKKEVDMTDEETALKNFFRFLKSYVDIGEVRLVSWNGNGFDFPFIFKRGMRYGLCKLQDVEKYISKNNPYHVDLMFLWAGYGKFEKLDTVSSVLIHDCKESFDVQDIGKCLETEEGQFLLHKYCLTDCELTYKLGEMFIHAW